MQEDHTTRWVKLVNTLLDAYEADPAACLQLERFLFSTAASAEQKLTASGASNLLSLPKSAANLSPSKQPFLRANLDQSKKRQRSESDDDCTESQVQVSDLLTKQC